MSQTKGRRGEAPVNRIERFIGDDAFPKDDWVSSHFVDKELSDAFLSACHVGYSFRATVTEDQLRTEIATDWTQLAKAMVERISLANRLDSAEKQIKNLTAKLSRMEGLYEKVIRGPVCVPISTFAPEPFIVLKEFSVVIQPEEKDFIATLFDANISSSGETQEEALANLKDLILMIFQSLEDDEDSVLGPAMIRQKHVLLSLIGRK